MTRRNARRASALCAGALLLADPHAPAAAHADPARPPAAEAWQQSSSVRLRADGSLSDVVGFSATDMWVVGQQQIWDVWQNTGAIRHWNGTSWSEVGIRNDATGAGHLRSIAAASPQEVWTVGDGHDGLPYVARGGPAGFDRVGVDQVRPGDWLGGVAATSGKVVAVGGRDRRPLLVTGSGLGSGGKWTIRTSKDPGTLYGVALSGKEGWAVGDTGKGPLIKRLTVRGWRDVPTPRIPGGYLRDVHIDGAKNAIAVGGVFHGPDEVTPLVLAWNGKRWAKVRGPGGTARLYGVTGDGKGRFWVSGHDPDRPGEAYLSRYDGRRWKVIRGGPADRVTVRLQSVTYVPGTGGVIAVGHVVDAESRYTDVVERFGPKDTASATS
jgi:hypothetical protein